MIVCRYLSKKAASERFGMHIMNADARGDAYKGGRGGEEEHTTENMSKSTKAIEKIFQA